MKAHLSLEAIEKRYRKAKDPVERSHWQIIWLLASGKTAKAITQVTPDQQNRLWPKTLLVD